MATRKWSLVVALCILSRNRSSGELRMTPNNTAGVVDTSVVLHCQGSVDAPIGGIIWREFISSTDAASILTLNSDHVPGAPNTQLYSITGDSSVAQYHLNIELAFLSGGRYQCSEPIYSLSTQAHVTVLQSAPVCSDTIQADGVVEEDETITYTCEVAYNSSSIDWPPVMTWTGPDGTITDVIRLSTSGGTVTSSVDVTGAPGLNGAVYSVRTHFEAYGGTLPADHATNVPTYSHSHSFNALQVYYSPRDIAFQPGDNTFNPGDQLTCSAVGNPAVGYKWYISTDNSTLADGAELTIREEMNGLTCGCVAYNMIRGTKHSSSKKIALRVNKSSGMSPGVVAGTAIAAILLLGILVVTVVALLLRMRKVPAEQFNLASTELQSTNVSSSHGVYETPDVRDTKVAPSEYESLSLPSVTYNSGATGRCEKESNRPQGANVNSCESEYEKPDAREMRVALSEYEAIAVPPVTRSNVTNRV